MKSLKFQRLIVHFILISSFSRFDAGNIYG